MFRKDLIPLLLERPLSINEISRQTAQTGKQTDDDIQHLLKSLRHTEFEPVITPALCRKCGFEFDSAKLRRPSRCPSCRATWITEPKIGIVTRRSGSTKNEDKG